MKAIHLGLTLALLGVAACADHDYTRPNTSQEQFDKDVANCRRQVDTVLARDRRIDSDISSTVGAQNQNMNQGNTLLRQQMESRSNSTRADRLMENCMSARGYQPVTKGSPLPAPAPAPAKQ